MQFFPGQKHALAAPFFSPFVRKSELLSYIVAIPKSCRAGKSPIISPSLLFFFPFSFLLPPSASPLFFCLTFTSSLFSPQPQPRTFNFSIKSRSRAAPAPSPKLHPSSLSPAARHSSCCNRCSPASSVHPSGRRASHHPLAQLSTCSVCEAIRKSPRPDSGSTRHVSTPASGHSRNVTLSAPQPR